MLQPKEAVNCLHCGSTFIPKKKGKFCSSSCNKRFYYLANKQRLDSYRAGWAKENAGKQASYVQKCRDAKPEEYRALRRDAESRRNARIASSAEHYTQEQWNQLLSETGNKCLNCKLSGEYVPLGADHILPVCMGGSDSIENIQPLCAPCNRAKHARHIDYRKAA
jgi:5-methylcytosine-specific restriction endonuclease McrA